jgi:uncharacterized protein (TIGR00304 family)
MRPEIGVLLIVVGFILVMISLVQTSGMGIGFGGVVMIGPIPIVFGSSPELALVSIAMTLAVMLLSLFMFRRRF